MKQMVLSVFVLGVLSLSGGQLMAAPSWGSARPVVYASSDWDYRRFPNPSQERIEMLRRLPPPSIPSRRSKRVPFLSVSAVVGIVSVVVALWQWVKDRKQKSISPSKPSFDLTPDPAPVPQQPGAPSQGWPQQSDYPQMPPQSPWEQPYSQPQPQQPWAPSQGWPQQSDYPQMPTSPQGWQQPGVEQGYQGGPQRQ